MGDVTCEAAVFEGSAAPVGCEVPVLGSAAASLCTSGPVWLHGAAMHCVWITTFLALSSWMPWLEGGMG